MIYISDLERIGFIFVVRSMVSRSHHKILWKCDMLYGERCYNAIICCFNNGKPSTLYDVLGKDKNDSKKNYLWVKKLLEKYKEVNTNGLKDIAHSRALLNMVSALTTLLCIFCLIYCVINIYMYGQTILKMFILFLLFVMFFAIGEVKVYFLQKIGGIGNTSYE